MPVGQPPSSRRYLSEKLSGARGTLRDALAGLRNLAQLLESIRVGPKALAAVIPDVYHSCAQIRNAARLLLASLAEQLPEGDPAIPELEAFFEPRLQQLEQALNQAKRRPMNARNRLALEGVVAQASRDLHAFRELMELLEEAIWGPAIEVDLLELLRETFRQSEVEPDAGPNEPSTLPVALALPGHGIELVVNPRVAIGLFTHTARLVSTSSEQVASVAVAVERADHCTVRLEASEQPGQWMARIRRYVISPTLPVLNAAAQQASAGLELSSLRDRCSVSWPASAVRVEPAS